MLRPFVAPHDVVILLRRGLVCSRPVGVHGVEKIEAALIPDDLVHVVDGRGVAAVRRRCSVALIKPVQA